MHKEAHVVLRVGLGLVHLLHRRGVNATAVSAYFRRFQDGVLGLCAAVLSRVRVLDEADEGFFLDGLQLGMAILGFFEAAVDESVEGRGLAGNESRVDCELAPLRADRKAEWL